MKNFIVKVLERIALLSLFVMLASSVIKAQDEVRLIIRGDDLGMSQGTLVAFEKAFNEGVLTCASMQVPGPWFDAAAELVKKNPGWVVGVHLTAVGEWRGYPWKPILPYDKVPSIVDEDGHFFGSPAELMAHKPKLEEIDAEFRAQIDYALKKGVNVQYIDVHYWNIDSYPGAREVVQKIGKDYNLPVSETFGEKEMSILSVPAMEKKATVVKMLDELEPGLHLWVCHPGIDSPEQYAFIHSDPRAISIDGVGLHRAMITDALTSIQVKSVILKKGIKLTNYKELKEEKQ